MTTWSQLDVAEDSHLDERGRARDLDLHANHISPKLHMQPGPRQVGSPPSPRSNHRVHCSESANEHTRLIGAPACPTYAQDQGRPSHTGPTLPLIFRHAPPVAVAAIARGSNLLHVNFDEVVFMPTIFGIPLVALEGAGMLLLLGLLLFLGVWWLDRLLLCTQWSHVPEKPTLLHASRVDARTLPAHSALYAMTDERITTLRCSAPVSSTARTARASYMSLPKSSDRTQRSGAAVHRHVPMVLVMRTAQLQGTWTTPPVHIPPTTS